MGKILSGSWCHKCGEVVDENRAEKISDGMIKFNQTDEGKELKKQAHEKRSATMAAEREKVRAQITHKKCGQVNCANALKNTKGELPISCFNAKSAAKDGLQTNCKECINNIKKEGRAGGKKY
jgi:hypothetical protein